MATVVVEITEESRSTIVGVSEASTSTMLEIVENQIIDQAPAYIDGGSPETIYLVTQVIDGGVV